MSVNNCIYIIDDDDDDDDDDVEIVSVKETSNNNQFGLKGSNSMKNTKSLSEKSTRVTRGKKIKETNLINEKETTERVENQDSVFTQILTQTQIKHNQPVIHMNSSPVQDWKDSFSQLSNYEFDEDLLALESYSIRKENENTIKNNIQNKEIESFISNSQPLSSSLNHLKNNNSKAKKTFSEPLSDIEVIESTLSEEECIAFENPAVNIVKETTILATSKKKTKPSKLEAMTRLFGNSFSKSQNSINLKQDNTSFDDFSNNFNNRNNRILTDLNENTSSKNSKLYNNNRKRKDSPLSKENTPDIEIQSKDNSKNINETIISNICVNNETNNDNDNVNNNNKSKKKKTSEAKEAAKILKQAEKEKKRIEREAKKEENKRQKEKNQALQQANKSRVSKKDSCKEMITDISVDFGSSQLSDTLAAFLTQIGSQIQRGWMSPFRDTIRWRRIVSAEYDPQKNLFLPLSQERIEEENFIVHYMTATKLNFLVNQKNFFKYIDQLISTFSNKDFTFMLLVEGLTKMYRQKRNLETRDFRTEVRKLISEGGNPKPRRQNSKSLDSESDSINEEGFDKVQIEEALIKLQLNYDFLIFHTTGMMDTAEWVSTLTADISTIPYKRSKNEAATGIGIGVCTEPGQVKSSLDKNDCLRSSLQQILLVTPNLSDAICKHVGNSGFSLIEGLKNNGFKALDGVSTSQRRLGPTLARTITNVFTCRDPDAALYD